MPVMEWKKDGTVAIVTMTNGENRHNPDFLAAILQTMDEIEKDSTVTAMILTSGDPKNWSLGIDLAWIMGVAAQQDFPAIKTFMYDLNRMFTRILLFPMPVIAAINGHTFGDGSIMAAACDFRFMKADRGFFCMPEVDINIPLLPAMQAMLQKIMPAHKFIELVLTGKRAGAAELAAANIIVKACADNEELQKEALAFARTFTKQRPIFAEMKRRMNKHILELMEKEDVVYIESGQLMM